MLLFHVKSIVRESCNFELAHLRRRKRKRTRRRRRWRRRREERGKRRILVIWHIW